MEPSPLGWPIRVGMTIAIIGPTSYIAEHLTSSLESHKKEYHLISLRNRGDIRYEMAKEVYFLEELTEAKVHAMGITSVIICTSMLASECDEDPQMAAVVNTRLVLMAVDLMQRAGVERFLYLSTIKVYGEDLSGNVTEKTAVDPQTIYSRTHYETEVALNSMRSSSGVEVLVIRLSNVFGAPVSHKESAWSLATNCFARQMAAKGSIEVKSPGVFRNILPISSLTAFILLWIETSKTEGFDVINIGSTMTLSMSSIAQLVQDIFCGNLIEHDQGNITEQEYGFRYSIDRMLEITGKSGKNQDRSVFLELERLCNASKRAFS